MCCVHTRQVANAESLMSIKYYFFVNKMKGRNADDGS